MRIFRNFRLRKLMKLDYINVFLIQKENVVKLTTRRFVRKHKTSWFKKIISIFVIAVIAVAAVASKINTFNVLNFISSLMISSSSNVIFCDIDTIMNIHASNVIPYFNNINFQLFMIHFISISSFKDSIQNFKFSISNFRNLEYFPTFTISNYSFCTSRSVADRDINGVENSHASKIIFSSFFSYFTSFQIYFEVISKLKAFVVTAIFFDLMMPNEIIIHRSFETQFFVVIVTEFSALFKNVKFVKLFEKNWMRISLRFDWQNRIFEKIKVYSLNIRNRDLIDQIFDKLHEQNRMSWTKFFTFFSYFAFCVWKKNVDDEF